MTKSDLGATIHEAIMFAGGVAANAVRHAGILHTVNSFATLDGWLLLPRQLTGRTRHTEPTPEITVTGVRIVS